MKFKKIRVKNLRSYKDQEIIFPEGSLLLSGDVGSGKSSILLAIEYALFGLQPGQKGASLLRNNEQFSEVELELEIEGKSIILERRLKRTPKGVSNEYAAITIDGIKEESSLTEIKLKVVNLLGYPQEFVKKNNILYRYTVHSPQEQMKQIILEDSESRLNILRHVFGIDKYKQIKDNLLILLNNLKGDSKILQGEISTLEEEKEKLVLRKSSLEELEKIIKINELSFEEKIRLRKKLEEELLEAKKKIDEKASFEKEVDKTKILITTKREILISLDRELGEVKRIISESGEDFREDDNKALLDKINEEKKNFENTSTAYANFTSQISFLKKDSNSIVEKKERIFKIDICPTCLQDVPESHKHNILNDTEKNLSEIKKNIELLEKNQREAIERIESQKSNLATLEENKIKIEILKSKQELIKRSKLKIEDLEKQKLSLQNDEFLLIKHIESLKESISKYTVFENKFKRKEEELRKAVLEEKNVEISLAESKKESELSLKEISLFEEAIKKKEISKKKLSEITELLDWLSTQFLRLIELTERNVLMKLRSEFSSLFQKWFTMLVPESNFESKIDDSFTPIIMQSDVEMDYTFLSGGERTAVALAYRLALNQTINSLMSKIQTRGLIILDEPTDGFSEAQIEKMRDILDEINAEQLIIVSHEQKVEGFVDNILKVSKSEDSSTISQTSPQNLYT